MDWQKEMDELRRREEFARGAGRRRSEVKRQHDGGRLTIRERIDRLVDAGQLPRDRQDRRQGRVRRARTTSMRLTPSNFVFGRAQIDGRPVIIGGDDFTVRGGSADATIKGKHNICERMANELRLPLIRLVEGSGGGGSVKTIETTGRANVPGVRGWERVVQQHGHGAARGARPRLGRRPRRGAPRRHALLGDGEGQVGDVRRRPAGGRAARPEARQERAGRLGDPAARPAASTRRSTPRTRPSPCARRFLSYLPSSVYDVPPRGPQTDDPAAPRGVAVRRHPARHPQAVQDARDRRGGGRPRLVLRDVGRSTAARSSPGLPGSTAGRSR